MHPDTVVVGVHDCRQLELELQSALSEVSELLAWKESWLSVEREWDPNALAMMLGAKLGERQRATIQREVPRLIDRVRRLEVYGDALLELVPNPPPKNCSCHISPPCSDCVDHAFTREVMKDWEDAKGHL